MCNKTSQKRQIHSMRLSCVFHICVIFFGITLVDGFMVVKVFTDMELYIFSVHIFVGGSIFQLPSSGQHKLAFTLVLKTSSLKDRFAEGF